MISSAVDDPICKMHNPAVMISGNRPQSPLIGRRARAILAPILFLALSAIAVRAGEADVIAAKVAKTGATYAFEVTIKSNDTGWAYYADAIEVLSPDGRVLGARVLLHPHEDEQPFTRDLTDVTIPVGITSVTVRARHKPAGYNGATLTVDLPK